MPKVTIYLNSRARVKSSSVWFQKPCFVQSKMFPIKLLFQNYMMRDNGIGHESHCQCTGLCLNRIFTIKSNSMTFSTNQQHPKFFSFIASPDIFHIFSILTKVQVCFFLQSVNSPRTVHRKEIHQGSKM